MAGSRLGGLITSHIDRYKATAAGVAGQIGVHPETMAEWRKGKVRALPSPEVVKCISEITGVPRDQVLDAALVDLGHKAPPAPRPKYLAPTSEDELRADAHKEILEGLKLIADARETLAILDGTEPDEGGSDDMYAPKNPRRMSETGERTRPRPTGNSLHSSPTGDIVTGNTDPDETTMERVAKSGPDIYRSRKRDGALSEKR